MIKQFYNFALNRMSYGKETAKGHPVVVAIEPTSICPMKCVMCPAKNMKRKGGFMDINLFKKIVDQAKKYSPFISLEIFGDSLMHPHIDKMVNYLRKNKIVSQISTNPILLTEQNIKKIENLDFLVVSLDATDETTYRKIRGGKNYSLAVKRINNLLRKKKRPFVVIRMIRLPGLDFKKYKKQWKHADKVDCKEPHTFGTGKSKWNYKGTCFKFWQGLHIYWDGRVTVCCFDYDGKAIIGDANKQTLEEIWNSDKMKEMRRMECPLCIRCTERVKPIGYLQYLINYIYWRNFRAIEKSRKVIRR